ncbi:MAG: hypothetical protein R3245_12565, partial [Kiloniellales bacterium]|nr:hypothetical protein [Kiloniellales bacterium]
NQETRVSRCSKPGWLQLGLLSLGFLALGGRQAPKAMAPASQLVEYYPNMPHGAAQAAPGKLWLDTKETVDNGNAPGVAGCQDVYATQNAACGRLLDRWGDFCASNTHIMERVIGAQCVNGAQPAPAHIDCRQFLNDPQARCVEIPNVCPPGNFLTGATSARCEIPVAPEPGPIPNPTLNPRG